MQTRFRANAKRFLALFAAILPLAFLSPTFESFVLSAPSGLTKDLANVASAGTLIFMFSYRIIGWAITATIFASIGIMLFGRSAQTFWMSALVWGASCFLTDVLTTPPSKLSALSFIVMIFGDINLGGPLGGFYIWIASSIIGRHYATTRKQNSPETLVTFQGQMTLDRRSLLTGYAGINLIAWLWVWATFGTISILTSYPAFHGLLVRLWPGTQPEPVLIGINLVAASVSLTVYVLTVAVIRQSVYVMLGPRSRAAIWYFAITVVILAMYDRSIMIHQVKFPGTISILSVHLVIFSLLIGFFVNSPLGTMLPTIQPCRTWRYRTLIFRFMPLIALVKPYIPPRILNALVIWFRAIRRPIRTCDAILHVADPSTQNSRIWSMTKSTIYLTFLTNIPVFWYLNVRAKAMTFQMFTYCVMAAAILVGGFTFHGVLRLSNRPSNLRTTLAVYSIPQLIFMPIISVLSIPALYYHYQSLENLRNVLKSLRAVHSLMIKLVAIFLVFSANVGVTTRLLDIIIGFITFGMQVMLLEILCHVYQTSRPKTYFAGVLALIVSAFFVAVSTIPARDLIVYMAS